MYPDTLARRVTLDVPHSVWLWFVFDPLIINLYPAVFLALLLRLPEVSTPPLNFLSSDCSYQIIRSSKSLQTATDTLPRLQRARRTFQRHRASSEVENLRPGSAAVCSLTFLFSNHFRPGEGGFEYSNLIIRLIRRLWLHYEPSCLWSALPVTAAAQVAWKTSGNSFCCCSDEVGRVGAPSSRGWRWINSPAAAAATRNQREKLLSLCN